jgi:hypothetical protein
LLQSVFREREVIALDGWQIFQPVTHWLIARLGFEKENKEDRMSWANHGAIVPNLIRFEKENKGR